MKEERKKNRLKIDEKPEIRCTQLNMLSLQNEKKKNVFRLKTIWIFFFLKLNIVCAVLSSSKMIFKLQSGQRHQ